MKRVFEWAFWAIGAVAIVYLALYLYASLTGRQFEPGDPIHIFRSPDARDYSAVELRHDRISFLCCALASVAIPFLRNRHCEEPLRRSNPSRCV